MAGLGMQAGGSALGLPSALVRMAEPAARRVAGKVARSAIEGLEGMVTMVREKIRGRGDYIIQPASVRKALHNEIINPGSTSGRSVHSDSRIMCETAYATSLVQGASPTAPYSVTVEIDPAANYWTVMSRMVQLYSQYRVLGFVVEIESFASPFVSGGAVGQIGVAHRINPLETRIMSFNTVIAQGGLTGAGTMNYQFGVECTPDAATYPWYWCRRPDLTGAIDTVLTDCGAVDALYLFPSTTPAGTELAKVIVHAVFEFKGLRPCSPMAQTVMINNTNCSSTANWFGLTAPASNNVQNYSAMQATPDTPWQSGTLTIGNPRANTYYKFQMMWTWTTAGVYNCPVPAYSNLQIVASRLSPVNGATTNVFYYELILKTGQFSQPATFSTGNFLNYMQLNLSSGLIPASQTANLTFALTEIGSAETGIVPLALGPPAYTDGFRGAPVLEELEQEDDEEEEDERYVRLAKGVGGRKSSK